MPLIRPFRGLRPTPEHASNVIAPPYDVLSSTEARERADGRPWSFLHISKPEIDLPEDISPYDDAVYQKGAENLKAMLDAGVLQRDAQDCYYAYRITMGEHVQTGLVAAASVEHYDSNRIRKHEFTRPVKENDRVNQIKALNAQTGPVFLVYRDQDEVDAILRKATETDHAVDEMADDGVRHEFWVIDNEADIDRLTALFDAMDAIYIADGHHRSASASRVAAERRDGDSINADANVEYFLSVIFPRHEMAILDYNRVITDLNGLDKDALLEKIAAVASVAVSDTQVKPGQTAEFGMYLDGQWYRLNLNTDLIPSDDPVGALDVSLLHNNIIEPFLGISDPRRDKRVDFVGGIRGLGELEKRVNSGEMAIAFALYPTTMDALMSVADANEVMPPKSTWFEPKLADGLVSHVLD